MNKPTQEQLALADRLDKDMKAAVADQFGGDLPARVYPSPYFDYDVFVIAPDGERTQRAPKYCATTAGAYQVARVLGAKQIVLGNAINFTGLLNSWNDTKLVPYLQFDDGTGKLGTPVNAGVLLDYFNGGYPPQKALADATAEVEASIQ